MNPGIGQIFLRWIIIQFLHIQVPGAIFEIWKTRTETMKRNEMINENPYHSVSLLNRTVNQQSTVHLQMVIVSHWILLRFCQTNAIAYLRRTSDWSERITGSILNRFLVYEWISLKMLNESTKAEEQAKWWIVSLLLPWIALVNTMKF